MRPSSPTNARWNYAECSAGHLILPCSAVQPIKSEIKSVDLRCLQAPPPYDHDQVVGQFETAEQAQEFGQALRYGRGA
jgi:hypothetical protein